MLVLVSLLRRFSAWQSISITPTASMNTRFSTPSSSSFHRATALRWVSHLGAGLLAAAAALPAVAQTSSVTIYGIYDIGVTRISNVNGHSLTRMEDSIAQGNRLGFRGVEDLGGGLKAFFNLEMGFAGDTGALRQGGLGFGRMSIVGLSHKSWGEVSLGRQFDQMNVSLIRFSPNVTAGVYSATVGDADRVAGNWLNNMVTYKTPVFGGLQLSGQYSFKEDGNSPTNGGRAYSLGATYNNGGFSAGAATTEIRGYGVNPAAAFGVTSFLGAPVTGAAIKLDKYRTAGVGAGYTFGKITVSGLYTRSRFEGAGSAQSLSHFAIPVVYRPSEQWLLEAGFAQSRMAHSRWRNFSLMADYFFSKRTDVYVSANLEKASGNGTSAVIFTLPTSSTNQQKALRMGIRHRF